MSIDNYRNFSILYVCCCTSSELAIRASDWNKIGSSFAVLRLEVLASGIGDKLKSLEHEHRFELNEITLASLWKLYS